MTSLLSKFKTDSDSETDVDVDKEPLGRKRVPDSRSGIPMMNKNSNNAQSQNIENLKKNSSEPVEALKGSIEESVELKQTKKKRKVFDEKVLTSRDGLLRIYEDFPSACKFRGRGYEAQDIKLLMNKYREWGFQLYPSLAFTDLLSRCETLGSKATVRACAENLRDRERTRYLNQVLGVPLSSILRPVTTLALDDEVPMDDLQVGECVIDCVLSAYNIYDISFVSIILWAQLTLFSAYSFLFYIHAFDGTVQPSIVTIPAALRT